MFAKNILLVFIGLSAGGIVAAGVFAFITAIDLVTRLAARTRTAEKIHLYEWSIILGGIFGNLFHLYHFPMIGGTITVLLFGIGSGIYTGCLVMSVAETMDVIPTMSRRFALGVGMQYIILGFALGKTLGSLIYFFNGWY